MWPHERSLVKDMQSKPFAVIGVNTNSYKPEKLKEVMDKEKLPWRSFSDPRGEKDEGFLGPVCNHWNLEGTPTLYLIDHKGVIRSKWLGDAGEKAIDEAINTLILAAKRNEKMPK